MLSLLGCSVSSCEPEPEMYGPLPVEYSEKPLAEETLAKETFAKEGNNYLENE
jgi:hypothetical protein